LYAWLSAAGKWSGFSPRYQRASPRWDIPDIVVYFDDVPG